MLAYNSDPALKAALLDQIRKHREMDQIVQGTYGNGTGEHWRGCAIACSLRSLDIVRGHDVAESYEDHSRYPAELGIPLVLAYLEDRFFENLPVAVAREWPERFAAAIVPGADLSGVWSRFALWLLTDSLPRHTDNKERDAIGGIAALLQRQLDGDMPTAQEWRAASAADAVRYTYASAYVAAYVARYAAAAEAARHARHAAAYVTGAAAHVADAAVRYAVRCADTADTAADTAAYAAADAVRYAVARAAGADATATADVAVYIQPMADKLIELLGDVDAGSSAP